jgi:hypothetical protein
MPVQVAFFSESSSNDIHDSVTNQAWLGHFCSGLVRCLTRIAGRIRPDQPGAELSSTKPVDAPFIFSHMRVVVIVIMVNILASLALLVFSAPSVADQILCGQYDSTQIGNLKCEHISSDFVALLIIR